MFRFLTPYFTKPQPIFLLSILLGIFLSACSTQESDSNQPPPLTSKGLTGDIRITPVDEQTNLSMCNALEIEIMLNEPVENVIYNYNFGDGTVQQSQLPSIYHTYSKSGSYEIKVEVNQGGRSLGVLAKQINVMPGVDCTYIVFFEDDEAILQTQSKVSIAEAIVEVAGGQLLYTYQYTVPGFAARLPHNSLDEVRRHEAVQGVNLSFPISLSGQQVIREGGQWGVDRIDQRKLPLDGYYNYHATGKGVNVYVVDSGLRVTHNEFTGTDGQIRVGQGINLADTSRELDDVSDCNGHGTHVAGTIAGNRYGVAKEATIIPVRIFGCGDTTEAHLLLAAIDWIVGNRSSSSPNIVNMSLSFPLSPTLLAPLEKFITEGIAKGLHFVVSAGNAYGDACNYLPAQLSLTTSVITVGGSNRMDRVMGMSNQGRCVSLFAPGEDITAASNLHDTDTDTKKGTSMAAPHVTGMLAQYLQVHPQTTPTQAKNIVLEMATKNQLVDFHLSASPNLLLHTIFEDTQENIVVEIEPSRVTLRPGQSHVFTAIVTGTDNKRVRWMFAGGALDSTTNRFTLNAPQSPGNYTLTATSVEDTTKKATATITVEEMTGKVCEGDAVIDGEDTAGDIARVQGCSEIRGSLKIYSTDLTDLTALRALQTVTGNVCVGCYINSNRLGNDMLTSLAGLNNLSSVGGFFYIYGNTALTSLAGLNNLSSVGGFLYVSGNHALTSLAGLDNLSSLGEGLHIDNNHALTSLAGLDNLSSLGKSLYIVNNIALTSLTVLDNLSSVEERLVITNNDALKSLTGLDKISSAGTDLYIVGNAALTSLAGLDNLSSVGGDLYIEDNDALTSLAGLDNLSSVGGDLYIWYNDALTGLPGLEQLRGVKGEKRIISDNVLFDCTPYNQTPPPYFPLTESTGNKVNCVTE